LYVILVYDINVARVGKILKISRKYLNWVQNSVLEGELTEASFRAMKAEMMKVIVQDEDSLLFYVLGNQRYLERKLYGVKKGGEEWIL
jgi:CRISPR-associated protein Cas2